MAKLNPPVYTYHAFNHSSTHGPLGCFHILAVMKKAAKNLGLQILLQNTDFIYFQIHFQMWDC